MEGAIKVLSIRRISVGAEWAREGMQIMAKQPEQPSREQDPQRLAEAIDRGEIPEGVPSEDAPRSDKRLDSRRSKYQLGQLNAN